jgi:hypothetical protein
MHIAFSAKQLLLEPNENRHNSRPMQSASNREYLAEDVLAHAREAFAETVSLKVKQLYNYVPKGSNSELTGDFIEELVRGFVQKWLGHRRLLSGAFYSAESAESKHRPLQIDGIVHDPHSGPVVLEDGGFVVVHPAFCSNVIEIKTSLKGSNIAKFQKRLRQIYRRYMHHVTMPHVMGIVIADSNPERRSAAPPCSSERPAYRYHSGGWCPIFILFSEKDGAYHPHELAIDAMIRCIYAKQHCYVNYLS